MNKLILFKLLKLTIVFNLIFLGSSSCHSKSGKRHKVAIKSEIQADSIKPAYQPKEKSAIINSPLIFKQDSSFQVKSSHNSILLCSWNLKDLGDSKNDDEMNFITNIINQFDIIAIQEVVAGPGGPKAIARLADILNRKGAKWDYTISDPTSGDNSYKRERYAFLWKPGKLKKIGNAWLEKQYNLEIDREPYFATFKVDNKNFTIVNFHAITKSKQPETEIKYFKFLPAEYPEMNLIFSGDFNCPQSHTVFNPLKKMGYEPIMVNQKTSLKKACNSEDCLASEFDNVFYNKSKVTLIHADVIHFYESFQTFQDALKISDHIPIVFEFSLN